MDLNSSIVSVVTLCSSLGVLGYIIKYVLPRIEKRIEDLEAHKAKAITPEQMRDMLATERELMREIISRAISDVELRLYKRHND